MAFSLDRFKSVRKGKVMYNIYLGEALEFSTKNFFACVQYLDVLQKTHPENNYEVRVEGE